MKGFVSIYVDLPEDLTDEQLFHLDAYLDDKKNELYEDIRNYLSLTPADFGRKAKAEHGVKDGRTKVETPPAPKKGKKVSPPSNKLPTEPVEGPSEGE